MGKTQTEDKYFTFVLKDSAGSMIYLLIYSANTKRKIQRCIQTQGGFICLEAGNKKSRMLCIRC